MGGFNFNYEKWKFLLELEPGERYVFDNSIEPYKPASSRKQYKLYQTVASAFSLAGLGIRLSIRAGDPRTDPNTGYVYCVSKDGRDAAPPPSVATLGGAHPGMQEWRKEQAKKRARKQRQLAKAKELPGQLQAELEKTELQRRTAGAIKYQMADALHNSALEQQTQLVQLVMAHARGAPIQVRTTVDGAVAWVDDLKPAFNLPVSMYRLKPKAREWYAVLSRDGKVTAIEHDITTLPRHDPACRVHLREVLEDDET
jgi:hypothetical protein